MISRHHLFSSGLAFLTAAVLSAAAVPADRPLKTFILAGQSNMVGWGDSRKLPDEMRRGSERVLMFEDGSWQPLRPHQTAIDLQRRVGLSEHSFGPEITFGAEMAKAWPDETIGIIKLAFGGTSLLAWKRDWTEEDADRVGQGRWGSLYTKLMEKVNQARAARQVEIVGFVWLQGGGDMKNVDVAKEYLANLQSLVAALREDVGQPWLPFIFGTARGRDPGFDLPDDLTALEPRIVSGTYPAAQWVLKAQFDAERQIPHARLVVLRAIEKHPQNIHYNTVGQLVIGRLFAHAYLESFNR